MVRGVCVLALCGFACALQPAAEVDKAHVVQPQVTTISSNAPESALKTEAAVPGVTNLAQAAKPQDPPKPNPLKITVAGRCFLMLAGLAFFVEAIQYFIKEYKARVEPMGPMYAMPAFLQEAFSDEKISKAKTAMAFVPVFSILMLFVMFRAKFTGIDDHPLYPLCQQFYVIGTAGIYILALEAIDLTVESKTLGNLSSMIGNLFTYAGYAGIVVGAFLVKKEGVPLSVPAKCILLVTGLVFLIQFVKQCMEFYMLTRKKVDEAIALAKAKALEASGAPAEAAPAVEPFDLKAVLTPRLSAAELTCAYAPHLCIVFFYIYFRYLLIEKEIGFDPAEPGSSDNPIYAMYFAVAGIYLQAAAALIFSFLNKEFQTFAKYLGLLCLYGGFSFTLYYAVTAKEIESIPIKCALGLISFVCVFQLCLVFLEEYLADAEDYAAKKGMFESIMGTLSYSVIISLLMIFIHFRSKMLEKIMDKPGGAPVPKFANHACYGALGAIAIRILFNLLGGLLIPSEGPNKGQKPGFVTIIEALCILCLYVSFGMLVTAAFLLGDGPVAETP